MRRLLRDERGNSVTEFALLGPTFLMMLFLVMEGGRALFTKQAVNELAAAAARCAAIHATGCTTTTEVASWTASRGTTRSRLAITAAMVTPTMSTTCNGQTGMAQVKIDYTYKKTLVNLLPTSVMPSTFTSTSCFPVVS